MKANLIKMKIFDFIKSYPTFDTEVNKLEGIRVDNRSSSTIIEINPETTLNSINKLLELIRTNNLSFFIFDKLYPSLSDPGAFLNYSQDQNEVENCWSMTLGNHGWSGGIYTIHENAISIQIHNLIMQKEIKGIQIDNSFFFSQYDKVSLSQNENENTLIYKIHSNPEN